MREVAKGGAPLIRGGPTLIFGSITKVLSEGGVSSKKGAAPQVREWDVGSTK
jgi:hypothetical protein